MSVFRVGLFFVLVLLLSSCFSDGNDSGSGGAAPTPVAGGITSLNARELALYLGLDGDPADGLEPVLPSEDPQVKLGQLLFFSRTLSGRFDVACASCHHPAFFGGDQLTLPVGVGAMSPETLGPGRVLDPDKDLAPDADGGPNVPRNSQTVINTALYDRALFHDGRIFVLDEEKVPEGAGQRIRTPESGDVADNNAGASLLQAQARFPLVNNNEMRGFMYPELATGGAYRARLVERLRGTVDQEYLGGNAASNWASLFQSAFGGVDTDGQMVSLDRMAVSLAAYQRSMTFTDTPWRDYIAGNDRAISEAAKRGARLFLLPKADGGLGCASCHAGDHFTDEHFYNTGFPQIGRGKRTDKSDHGRAEVSQILQTEENQYTFRVPGLINVAVSAPFGHAGSFATLEGLLSYHANPRGQVDLFDFDLQHLPQIQQVGIMGTALYPLAETRTREAINASSFQVAEALLPARVLSDRELEYLVAFLNTLSDACVTTNGCLNDWVADKADDPDGNLLVIDSPGNEGSGPPLPEAYPDSFEMVFPVRPALATFTDASTCTEAPSAVANTGAFTFLRRDQALGLEGVHGFSEQSWLAQTEGGSFALDETLEAGGISAAYINGDCWPDLLFAGGDGPSADGLLIYLNQGGQDGFTAVPLPFAEAPTGVYSNIGIADLNGDYRRELVLGNLHQWPLRVYSENGSGEFEQVAELPMGRSTIGMAFADVTGEGYPEMYLAHWSSAGLPGSAPAFWDNTTGSQLRPADQRAGTTEDVVSQSKNFSPGFVDLDGDADLDLAIASDFTTSVLLENTGDGSYVNVTKRKVVDDAAGMGAALADFNNDGLIDWVVTAIEWPRVTDSDGNRLYINTSSVDGISVASSPTTDGVKDGAWGWGACAADFDNDGWQDIFHVNGYGKLPADLAEGVLAPFRSQYDYYASIFADKAPRLFINQRDGTFLDRAAAWGLTAVSEGRGVICLDYDRDGDVDVGLVNHSVGIQFFENQAAGSGRHFLSLRLVGAAPNTDALGARVTVRADVDGNGSQALVRTVSANSNFASQNTTDLHFGLGIADTVTLEVSWPGESSPSLICPGLSVDRFLIIDDSAGGASCPAP